MRAAASRSSAGGWLRILRASGACRSRSPPTACQPEKAIDALEHDAGEVLNFDCRGAFDSQHQNSRLGLATDDRSRPLDLLRLRMSGDLGADDLGPAGHQLGRGKALPGESIPQGLVQKIRQRARIGFGGLVHGLRLCHRSRHDRSSPQGAEEGSCCAVCAGTQQDAWRSSERQTRSAGSGGAARLVRPPSPHAAVAGARRREARSLSRLAVGSDAAADYGQGSRALFRPLHRALAERAGAGCGAPWRRCSGSGLGSDITRGREICMPAPRRWSRTMADAFRPAKSTLAALPGIGNYTAAAIAAIAFDLPAAAVDGNVERVMARLFAIEAGTACRPGPNSPPHAILVPAERAGDFAQALMDLGATICTPKAPACALCPWMDGCAARRGGDPETFPVKAERKKRRCAVARPLC